MQRQKYLWNPLVDYWFRMEIEGWENLPEPPVLLVGIHSGAPFVWDAWTVGVQWWRRFGQDRLLHGTAHDALMAIPLIGRYFRAMGVLPAAPDSMATALAEGRDVAVWPGGEVDSLRPWIERDKANLAGRNGFVKMAIRAGVPIVPIATVGGADAMPVLIRGDRLSHTLRLDKLLRLKVFPVAVSLPWGIAPAACRNSRCRPRSELDSCPRSKWTTTPNARTTPNTSNASTTRFSRAFSAAWMHWRASAHFRCSASCSDGAHRVAGQGTCGGP